MKTSIGPVLLVMCFLLQARPASGQTTILSVGFEGEFPGAWSILYEGDAFWSDVNTRAHTGGWSGYCAGGGFFPGPPYPPESYSEMYRSIDLSGYTSATLTFWYFIPSIEEGIDACAVFLDDTVLWSRRNSTIGWQQQTISLNPYLDGVRNLSFVFQSDDSIELEGFYVDDILVTGTPAGGQPNLTSVLRPGWSDRLVVSTVTGTSTDSVNLSPSDSLYVDWALVNGGAGATAANFATELYVDDVLRNTWTRSSPLNANTELFVEDYPIGSLPAGTHTIRLRIDSGNSVTESNEQDNEVTKTIVVLGNADIRIAPLSVTLNVSNGAPGFAPLLAADLAGGPDLEQDGVLAPEEKFSDRAEVMAGFQFGRATVRVIVNLTTPGGLLNGPDWDDRAKLRGWQQRVQSRQDEVIQAIPATAGLKLRHRFENQAGFSAEVTPEALERLARHPRVRSIEPVRIVQPMLAQGIPLMRGSLYRSTYNGSGVAVAIVDTGVDYNHPRLGGGGFPNSKVIGGFDFGDFDANPAPWDDAHGTACAGIAAGNTGTVGDYIGGVAYNAKLYALKIVEDGFSGATDDAIIAAWNWCITHKNDSPANPILVISTSFGGGRFLSTCDSVASSYRTAAINAAAAGITVLVSAGNEGYCNALAAPACISSVIAVGSVYDASYGTVTGCIEAESCVSKTPGLGCPDGYYEETTAGDKVPAYSNTASFLGILAPANRAHTTDMVGSGGYSSSDYTTSFGGTSAACPYAAGAVAVIQSAARTVMGRYLTPAEVRAKLIATGDNISDTKAAVTKPRVNVARAIESLGANVSFTIFNDGNAPLNVLSITAETPAPWLSWLPAAPFMVGAGQAQVVALTANTNLTPFGQTQTRLLVESSDADESPYPGGVMVTTQRVDTRPALQIRLVNGQTVISWTTNSAGYTLQSSGSLSPGAWGTVGGTPVVISGQKFVTNVLSSSIQFYRLIK